MSRLFRSPFPLPENKVIKTDKKCGRLGRMTPDMILVKNIRTLLDARHIHDGALARHCGHSPPWLSKIMKGERQVALRDLAKIGAFFAVPVSDLLSPDLIVDLERRQLDRRRRPDRRSLLHLSA